MDLVTFFLDGIWSAIEVALIVLFMSVGLPVLWAVTTRRTHDEWSKRWWAIWAGAILIAFPPLIWTHPVHDLDADGALANVLGVAVLAGILCGPWLFAWGIRGKKIEVNPKNSKPQKGIIYTSSEIEAFKSRGLM
jgi:hypothetical protein